MQVKIGKKNWKIYAFDIETHNDEESIANNTTSMWLGCIIDENSSIDDPKTFTYTMEETIARFKELSHPVRHHGQGGNIIKNTLIYVYNLAFEYSFLLPVLLKEGWQWKDIINDDDEDTCVFNAVTNKTCASVWEVHLHFDKDGGEVVLRDLAKMYAGGLGRIAKSFGLDTQKTEIDYTLNRLHDYKITPEEYDYIFKDCRIVVEILLKVIENNDRTFFNNLSMSGYACEEFVRATYKKAKKPYLAFRKECPKINGEESDFLRKATSGGITYATPRYQFKELNVPVCHIDKYSMHPSSAYYNFFPVGTGTYGTGRCYEHDKITCYHVRISYTGVKLHSVISLIGIEFIDDYDLWCWDFELETMKKCYENLTIEYIEYYTYERKRLPWRNFFRDAFAKKEKAEREGDAFNRLRYKLLMNSSYGKLLEKPHLCIFRNIINDDGLIDSEKVDKEIKKEDNKYNAKYTYLPIGSCIPAYSRCDLVETALKIGWEKITYFDTDSIFFIWDKETQRNMEQNVPLVQQLGGWKIEEFLSKSQFAVPKRYKGITINGESYVKAGGFNFSRDTDFMSIDLVSSKWNVKTNYRANGGTLIIFKEKEIKVPEKYLHILAKNVNIEKEGQE